MSASVRQCARVLLAWWLSASTRATRLAGKPLPSQAILFSGGRAPSKVNRAMKALRCLLSVVMIIVLLGISGEEDILLAEVGVGNVCAMDEINPSDLFTSVRISGVGRTDGDESLVENTYSPTGVIEHVAVSGPTTGVVGVGYSFTATVSPHTAAQPITYVWQATGQKVLTQTNGGLSDTSTFTWTTTGTQVITVTALNRFSRVSGVHSITITNGFSPLTSVIISGPQVGFSQSPYTFIATVSPATAIWPITYVWQATGQQDVVTTTNALSHTVTYAWNQTGAQTIMVTATNGGPSVADSHSISISMKPIGPIYLPLVLRCVRPGKPVLSHIENPDVNGSYQVCWSAASEADFYVLEEAMNSLFAGSTMTYTEASTCHSINGKDMGWYYYRVKACNGCDCECSDVQEAGAWCEHEDNDLRNQANGPLISGRQYCGRLNDRNDYFGFDQDAAGLVEADLTTHHTGARVYFMLGNPDGTEVCRIDGRPYHCEYPGPKGRYYVRIFKGSDYTNTMTYTLSVTFH